jgi:ketosteroid isomerase-like protein
MDKERELGLRFLAHVSRCELQELGALFASDAEIWMPGHPTFTASQFCDLLALSFERMVSNSFAMTPIGTTAEGERVAIEANSTATLKSGGQYENRYHFLFIVREGKVRSLAVYAASDFAVTAAWTGGQAKGLPPRLHLVSSVPSA